MKKILILIVLIITMLFTSGCEDRQFSADGATYRVINSQNKYVAIGKLDENNMDSSIFIPAKVNGYTVTKIGYIVYMNGTAGILNKIGNVKRLYFPDTIQSIEGGYLEYVVRNIKSEDDAILCFYCGKILDLSYFYPSTRKSTQYYIYVPIDDYEEYVSFSISYNSAYKSIIQKANIAYYLNYDQNDYYYVDYYNNGEIIKYIPPIPEREGYTFGGWFKEVECLNQWDFETDTVQTDENKEEVGLYAKWVKN